jgi:hypothetical protein
MNNINPENRKISSPEACAETISKIKNGLSEIMKKMNIEKTFEPAMAEIKQAQPQTVS